MIPDDVSREMEQHGYASIEVSSELAALTEHALRLAADLFSLPTSVKATARADEKRFVVGWRRPPGDKSPSEVWQARLHEPEGFWPDELRHRRAYVDRLLIDAIRVVSPILDGVAHRVAGMTRSELAQSLECGHSTLRFLSYGASSQAVRFPAHVDYDIATIFTATTSGLEVQQRDGSWSRIATARNQWLLCAGEMLEVLTGGTIPAVWHRVRGVEGDRYSLAIFVHPEPSFVLSQTGNDPLTAEQYFTRRIQQLLNSKD